MNKNVLSLSLFLALGWMTSMGMAQCQLFSTIVNNRVYWDSFDPDNFYQPGNSAAFNIAWAEANGDGTLYFMFGYQSSGAKECLYISTTSTPTSTCFPGTNVLAYSAENEWTFSVPASEQDNGELLNIFFFDIQTDEQNDIGEGKTDSGRRGIVQVTTYTQTGAQSANQLSSQSNHLELQGGQIFSMQYEESSCSGIASQLTIKW